MGLPGQGRVPTQSPVCPDQVVVALNGVEIHFDVEKPGFDKADRLLIAIASSKLIQRVFKVNVVSVKTVGLIVWKALIVILKNLQKVHRIHISQLNPR